MASPQPVWPPVAQLDWRNAPRYVGQTVDQFCKHFRFTVEDRSDITLQRLASTIKVIRIKKAFQARIHILNDKGEWIQLLQPYDYGANGNCETYVVSLSARPSDRIEMFGTT